MVVLAFPVLIVVRADRETAQTRGYGSSAPSGAGRPSIPSLPSRIGSWTSTRTPLNAAGPLRGAMAQFLPDRETSLFARPTMDAFAQDATQAVVTAQINFIRRLSAEIQTVSCPELQRQAQNVITMTPGAKR